MTLKVSSSALKQPNLTSTSCFILFLPYLSDLNILFQLLDRIPNVNSLLTDYEEYILSEGLMVMKANYETITTDPERYVVQLLELFNRFTKLVEDAFNEDPRFMTSRDKVNWSFIIHDIFDNV